MYEFRPDKNINKHLKKQNSDFKQLTPKQFSPSSQRSIFYVWVCCKYSLSNVHLFLILIEKYVIWSSSCSRRRKRRKAYILAWPFLTWPKKSRDHRWIPQTCCYFFRKAENWHILTTGSFMICNYWLYWKIFKNYLWLSYHFVEILTVKKSINLIKILSKKSK